MTENYTIHFYADQEDAMGRALNCSADVQAKNAAHAVRLALGVMGDRGTKVTGVKNIKMQDAGGNMVHVETNYGAIYRKITA